MASLLKRRRDVEPTELPDVFDRMFEDWVSMWPWRSLARFPRWTADDLIRVDEFRENGNLVIRAELPGIDPDKDVELTVEDGMLHIQAERREEEKSEDQGYLRRELRYGTFSRTLPLPSGVTEKDVKASYKDGILEIRVPVPAPATAKIPISRS
jgi:HSP20 family protein